MGQVRRGSATPCHPAGSFLKETMPRGHAGGPSGHLGDFAGAFNFARRLKTLSGLTPHEYICKIWTSLPDRSIPNPIHKMPGLNTQVTCPEIPLDGAQWNGRPLRRWSSPQDSMNASLMARCKELIKNSETELEARVVLKIDPVKAGFSGAVTLETTGAPDGFSLTEQGSGGPAGHATGSADVTLVETSGKTVLTYQPRSRSPENWRNSAAG